MAFSLFKPAVRPQKADPVPGMKVVWILPSEHKQNPCYVQYLSEKHGRDGLAVHTAELVRGEWQVTLLKDEVPIMSFGEEAERFDWNFLRPRG